MRFSVASRARPSEVVHGDCPGCGRLLIKVWTGTVFMIMFSEWTGQPSSEDE